MSLYLYLGVDTSVTLRSPDAASTDVLLWSNQPVELPDGHELTRLLVAKGLLRPVQQPGARAASAKSKTK